MLIYNTTFHVEDDIRDAYLEYMKRRYIPEAANSGFVHAPCFARIFPQHEEQGASYSLQLKAKNLDTLNYWLETDGKRLQRELSAKFGNNAVGFATLLEEMEWNGDD